MLFFTKRYIVRQNMTGYLFRENKLEKKLAAGYHDVSDFNGRTEMISLPNTKKMLIVTNQEVLTKDNVALRFSFYVIYQVTDGEKLLNSFALDRHIYQVILEAEQRLINAAQVSIRKQIAAFESEALNEKRTEMGELKTADMENEVAEFGFKIDQVQLKDITFPKAVQDLFAKHLEAKIRSKTELENARTAVAAARALKNASELMKDDENIRFFQVMETITKIAEKGKHTFMIGDMQQVMKK